MSRTRNDQLAGHRADPQPEPPEGSLGPPVPDTACRLCWHRHLVRRGGVWMLQHRGPLSDCTHSCHDQESLLPSVS